MPLLLVLGKIDLINRIIHTQKLVNVLSKIYPNLIVLVEAISPAWKSYFHEQVLKYSQSKCIFLAIDKSFLQKIRLSIIHDVFASLVIAITLKNIVKNYLNNDRIIFVKGFNAPLVLLLKLLGYRIIQFAGGFGSVTLKGVRKYWLLLKELLLLKIIDLIILEAPSISIYYTFLQKFKRKIFPYGALYVDNEFKVIKPLEKRKSIIGYVGALTQQKGIIQLLLAMNILKSNNVRLLIIGDGPLKNRLSIMVKKLSLEDRVLFLGTIPHLHLPYYLNEMKLLVLPSLRGEGLPNVIIEAMACGTPVLATPVGGIPDVIKDNETGFILVSTEPSKIAAKINELLAKDLRELQKVVNNALNYIDRNYRLQAAIKRYKLISKYLKA
ncbi:MAG: glycosyltransferase family 4 protein [Thermofilum sp.]|nr:glycosyltransferase family 4 protein [Thermofilum sp.]